MVNDFPSRDVAIEWCRANAPDLRIQHGDGASGARFTFRGRAFELETAGVDHRDTIVRKLFETLRALQGEPVRGIAGASRARAVEREIVAARWRGQHAEADALEQELLRLRAGVAPQRPAPRVRHEGVIPNETRTSRWHW